MIKDFFFFIKFFFLKNKINYLIFLENENTSIFFEKYIVHFNKKKENVIVLSFTSSLGKFKNFNYVILKSNFFRLLFFKNINLKYVYSTTPDLNQSIFVKSIYKNVKYLYLQHSHVSLLKAYKKDAFLDFDFVSVINKYQEREINYLNRNFNKNIRFFKLKYSYPQSNFKNEKKQKNKILIAPTWDTGFYNDNILFKIIELLGKNYDLTLRPHYMSIKKKELNFQSLKDKINIDISIKYNFDNYDYLISDWSGIYLEFAIFKMCFPILINTNMKRRNLHFKDYVTIEEYLRDKIAFNLNIDQIDDIKKLFDYNTRNLEFQKTQIKKFSNLFY
jgi:hypothetical protein